MAHFSITANCPEDVKPSTTRGCNGNGLYKSSILINRHTFGSVCDKT